MTQQNGASHWRAALFIVPIIGVINLSAVLANAAASNAPLPLILDAAEEDQGLRKRLTNSLEQELQRPIIGAINVQSDTETLTIVINGSQAKLVHASPLETKVRVTMLPSPPEERVRRLVWLAGNLCRNQVAQLAAAADEETSQVVADTTPSNAPPEVAPATEPMSLSLNAQANEAPAQTHTSEGTNWLLRMSAGPSVTPYWIYRQHPFELGTNLQVDLEYKPADKGNWMASLVRDGSSVLSVGVALSRVWVWRLQRSELKLFAGVGIARGWVQHIKTVETSFGTLETSTTTQHGADPFGTLGGLWTFPFGSLTGALKLSAFVPHSDPKRQALVSLTAGFAWNL